MFSFSQLKLYQTCPKQYEFKYLNNFENEQMESLQLLQGNLIHDALRRLYQKVSFFTLPSKEEFLEYFTTQWKEKLPQHNFLDLQEKTVSEAYAQLSLLLTTYYEKYAPFNQETIIGLEQKLFAYLPSENERESNSKFSATIDRITKKGDTFIIYDYKTNKNLTSEIENSHREQMYLYARAVQQNYGKYCSNIEICLEYLTVGKQEYRTVDPQEMQTVLQKYASLSQEVETKKVQFGGFSSPTIFPANKGEYCRRCSFMQICPLFSEQSTYSSSELIAKSLTAIVHEYEQTTFQLKVLEEQKETLKTQLEQFFETSDYQRIFGSEYQISYSKRNNRTIKDTVIVEQILSDKGLFSSSLSLDKQKIKKLKEQGSIPEELVPTKETYSLSLKN